MSIVPNKLEIKMPKQLHKFLQDSLSKIKKPSIPLFHLPSSKSFSWILRGCKHPKTQSFAVDNKQNNDHTLHKDDDDDDEATTLSDIYRFLFENFKSLYENDLDEEEDNDKSHGIKEHNEKNPSRLSFDSPPVFINPLPDLCSSGRFFVARGKSGSSIEESEHTGSRSAATTTTNNNYSNNTVVNGSKCRAISSHDKEIMGAEDFIAIVTYSLSPCDDFRHSMQEMIEARLHHNGKVNWEFMEELLFCYLNLNNKKSYKYILSAFVDLIVVLRDNAVVKIPVTKCTLKYHKAEEGRCSLRDQFIQ